ncbi:MAG: hypothetical protein HC912_03855 [Saprospiraceae bacterium]|nr:hypothetical protein [Saprospiraceae bacterium]
MKKQLKKIALVATFSLMTTYAVNASCSCDASTRFKCSGVDAQGNKCKGTGAALVKSDIQIF